MVLSIVYRKDASILTLFLCELIKVLLYVVTIKQKVNFVQPVTKNTKNIHVAHLFSRDHSRKVT